MKYRAGGLYRGEGLALVLPHDDDGARRAGAGYQQGVGGGWLARALDEAQPEPPLVVDETVLHLCNQAYDLAVAHRAPKVRLEHLIHAMTLVEAAVETLEAYQIHVTTLRRESAAIIASEVPFGRAGTSLEPGPSEEFDELLHLAAERSFRRRSPVTTEDLLDTLLDMKRDLSSRHLLARHRQDWALRGTPDTMPGAEPRERVRVSAGSHHMGESRKGGDERQGLLPTHTDSLQNSRIDVLERAVRELSEDLNLNRQTFASLVDELRGGRAGAGRGGDPAGGGQGLYVGNGSVQSPAAGRSYAGPSHPDAGGDPMELDHDHIIDRLYLIERNVEGKFSELARTWAVLGQRLETLEEVLEALPGGTGGGISDDLAEKLSTLGDLPARINALEPSLAALPARLAEMERRVLSGIGAAVPAEVAGKLDKIDGALGGLGARLAQIENRMDEPAGNWDLAPFSAGLKDIESRTGDTHLMIDVVDERIQNVESLIDAQQGRLAELSTTIGTELKAVSSAIGAQGAGGEHMQALIRDGMRGVADTFDQQKSAIAQSVTEAVAERMSSMSAMMQARQTESGQLLAQISERISLVEASVTGDADRVSAVAQDYKRDSSAIHDALVAINSNQEMLATSMDQWRQDSRADMVGLTTRLAAMEQATPAANGDLDDVKARLEKLAGALDAQQLDGWSRFRIWLYGTNDWYGASWGARR